MKVFNSVKVFGADERRLKSVRFLVHVNLSWGVPVPGIDNQSCTSGCFEQYITVIGYPDRPESGNLGRLTCKSLAGHSPFPR